MVEQLTAKPEIQLCYTSLVVNLANIF